MSVSTFQTRFSVRVLKFSSFSVVLRPSRLSSPGDCSWFISVISSCRRFFTIARRRLLFRQSTHVGRRCEREKLFAEVDNILDEKKNIYIYCVLVVFYSRRYFFSIRRRRYFNQRNSLTLTGRLPFVRNKYDSVKLYGNDK